MTYQPFLIGNFRSGLNMAAEPWLIPRDAFQSLINARLYRGVVSKVSGYTPFTKTYEGVISELDPVPDGVNIKFTATLPRTPRTVNFAGYSVITTGLTSEIFTYGSFVFPLVILVGSNGGSGTLDLATKELKITTGVAPPIGSTVFFQYWANPRIGFTRYPIVGIHPFFGPLGEAQTLIFDTQKLCTVVPQDLPGGSSIFGDIEGLNVAAVETPHDYYSSAVIVGDSATVLFSGTIPGPISPGTVNFYQFLPTGEPVPASSFDAGAANISDNGFGALAGTGSSSGTGAINYYTGAWTYTFTIAPALGDYFDATVGIFGQIFNGEFNDFFSVANYQNKAFFCNNVDPVFYYDGRSVRYLRTNLTVTPITSAGGIPNNTSPYITSALHVFVNRERLLLLSPKVIVAVAGNTLQSTAIYWSNTSNPLSWTNGGSIFAPTSQPIVTAGFVNSDLIVRHTSSEYICRYTGDAFGPFRLDPTNNIWSCASPFGTISYDSYITSIGMSAIVGSDGWNVKRVDEAIPDFTDAYRIADQYPIPYLAEQYIANAYGHRFDSLKEGWLCYASEDSEGENGHVLAFNYLDGTYSIYEFPLNCLGSSTSASFSQTWGNSYDLWEDAFDTWGNYQKHKGSAIDLGGDLDGLIYEMDSGTKLGKFGSDSGKNFYLDIITKDFNPFIEQGQLCRLGYIDFLVSGSPVKSSFTVRVYCNNNITNFFGLLPDEELSVSQEAAYKSISTISLNTQEKVWVRVYVGLVAQSHTIRIFQAPESTTKSLSFSLHAMILYMQPAGRLFS